MGFKVELGKYTKWCSFPSHLFYIVSAAVFFSVLMMNVKYPQNL